MTDQLNPTVFLQTDAGRVPADFPEALREQWLKEAAPIFAPPVLWLRHPTTGLTHLWEIGADDADLIRRVQKNGLDGVGPDARARLTRLGAVYDAERNEQARVEFEQAIDAAQSTLRRHGYAVLRNLLLPGYFEQTRRYGRRIDERIMLGDRQVPKRKRKHNDVFCRVLHFDLYRTVGRICEESIQPSYCYLAIYLPGSALPRHTDRPQCRWNASMLLDSQPLATPDYGWPIFVECPDDSVRAATAGIGDIVIYNGIATPHWREEMPDRFEYQSICFFHFVLADFGGSLA